MTPESRLIVRFTPYQRVLHLLMFGSFLGLAATGLPLLFSDMPWAAFLARAMGGIAVAGVLHRLCAFVMLVVFAAHVAEIAWRVLIKRERGLLWGPSSMVPQPRDAQQIWEHLQWFLERGPRPRFDRYTYWEKFDYWAVFWGMFIIGGSGLLLWFPEAFAAILPGWIYNVALIVHGEEALLATGFIFTIHFFNSHFRPEKFPMDMVMFTGHVSEADLQEERPAEYERIVKERRLDALAAKPEGRWVARAGAWVGGAAVLVGLALLVLIVIGVAR